ncbi:MAG: hypothetical protein MMC33_010268 [Icmadophila ericetorum]|nr:hypothetical protein [Icmadophila ericetorum]
MPLLPGEPITAGESTEVDLELDRKDRPESFVFCAACQSLDISVSHFRRPTGITDKNEVRAHHKLGTLQEIQKRPHCPLCRLISRICTEEPLRNIWNDDTAQYMAYWTHEIKGAAEMPSSYILLTYNTYETLYDYQQCTIRVIPVNESDLPYSGRIIDPGLMDLKLAEKWLKRCETHKHFQQSAEAYKTPAYFRIIDVEEYRVVKMSDPCRYLALSYVWGQRVQFQALQSNLETLSTEYGILKFQELVPATILDAISFTKKIGERYLWVDSLCIVQDDLVTKTLVIADMDLVYSQALVVLIVAGSADANSGISGMCSRLRKRNQIIEKAEPGFILMAQIHVKDYMSSSVYNTRAWTFQEQQLVNRSFILVNDQVYFTCPTHAYSEDTVSEYVTDPDTAMVQAASIHRLTDRNNVSAINYIRSVEQYTRRLLTFESDKLNAFNGILKVHCQGLLAQPFFGTPPAFFDLAMLWQPKHDLKRIPEFPSWSWAGWSGEIMWYSDTQSLLNWTPEQSPTWPDESGRNLISEWLVKRTWIDWHVTGNDYSSERLLWERRPSDGTSNEGSAGAITSSATKSGAFSYQSSLATSSNPYGRTTPTSSRFPSLAPPPPPNPAVTNQLPPGTLRFTSISCTFKITSSPSSYIRYSHHDPYPSARPTIAIFLLQNRHSQPCGWVQLTQDHVAEMDHTLQEFLLLSEADYHMEYTRPHEGNPYAKTWNEGWLEYYALMVRDRGDGVLGRVGLGRVMKGAVEKDAWGEGNEGTRLKEVWLA